jgi:hypothetical protein
MQTDDPTQQASRRTERATGHLIHIGYPKTGSNFLRRWFETHPELAFTPRGIAGFSDINALVREAAAPTSTPRYRVTSAEALAIPTSSVGLPQVDYDTLLGSVLTDAQTAACGLLAGLFPGAHILIVTRGVRSLMLSSYSQYVRTGGHMTIGDLWRIEQARSPWDYDSLIAQYRHAFGEANVLVLPYELLRDDPAAFLRAIAGPLGLSDGPMPTARVNESLSATEMAWYPRLGRAIRWLPAGRGTAQRLLTRAGRSNRLRGLIALLQRAQAQVPVTADVLTDEAVERWAVPPHSLRENPHYRAYASDYFPDRPGA